MSFSWDCFFQAYLVSLIFWLGLPLGSLLIMMMHTLTGGRWGQTLRPYLMESSRGILLLGVLFLPVCLWGLPHLYSWSEGLSLLGKSKHVYLSPLFFTLRTIFYFCLWWGLRKNFLARKNKSAAASLGLILMLFTMSFAAIDWVMSLEPNWYSTLFGLLIIVGMGVAALSFAILRAVFANRAATEQMNLGNLLLAFVMVWAYLGFMQYLIAWMGNLPNETNWFFERTKNGWGILICLLIVFQFFAPFTALLFRSSKKSGRVLTCLAILILYMHALELEWMILPALRSHWSFQVFDLVLFVLIGGIWNYFCRAKKLRKEGEL